MSLVKYFFSVLFLNFLWASSSFQTLRPFAPSRSSLWTTKDGENWTKKQEVYTYEGPHSTFDEMMAGTEIEDLGLCMMVGKSKVCDGLGLFMSLAEGVCEATHPIGTILCGYSKGTFTTIATGDKTVAYSFNNASQGVIFEKELQSIRTVITKVRNRSSAARLSDLLVGHSIYEQAGNRLELQPEASYTNRYFVPKLLQDTGNQPTEWGPEKLGQFANDMAYQLAVTKEEYEARSPKYNALQIVWRLEFNGTTGRLMPTYPLVLLRNDVRFTNTHPMEVGLHYSWRFWEAVRFLSSGDALKADQI
jgi:hypothetical protein